MGLVLVHDMLYDDDDENNCLFDENNDHKMRTWFLKIHIFEDWFFICHLLSIIG